jgi:ABC-type molybdate transport system ATPase subunit
MKTTKLLTAIIAIFLFSNFSYAANPNKLTDEQVTQKLVDKLSNDIVLTDSQKVVIKTKALEYVQKRADSNSKKDKKEKSKLLKQSFQEYMNFLSMVLTEEQKQELIKKHIEQTGVTIKEFN